MNSENIAEYEKQYFLKIMNGTPTEVELTSALVNLSRMLTEHHGKAPVIIIDEYDTPIQEGYSRNFYEKIIGFMRNFFSGAFKVFPNLLGLVNNETNGFLSKNSLISSVLST